MHLALIVPLVIRHQEIATAHRCMKAENVYAYKIQNSLPVSVFCVLYLHCIAVLTKELQFKGDQCNSLLPIKVH